MEEQSRNGLYVKISKVMEDVSYLQKDDNIKFGTTNYKAISEEKVTQAVRTSLIKNGLVILPIKQDHSKEGNLTTVNVTYKIVDIESGDFEELVSSGTGVDMQDKGVGKAMTYAYKYLLLRTFAIPTGEDTDKISNEELEDKAKSERLKKAKKAYNELLTKNPHVFTKNDIDKYKDNGFTIDQYAKEYMKLSKLKKEREEILQLENENK